MSCDALVWRATPSIAWLRLAMGPVRNMPRPNAEVYAFFSVVFMPAEGVHRSEEEEWVLRAGTGRGSSNRGHCS